MAARKPVALRSQPLTAVAPRLADANQRFTLIRRKASFLYEIFRADVDLSHPFERDEVLLLANAMYAAADEFLDEHGLYRPPPDDADAKGGR